MANHRLNQIQNHLGSSDIDPTRIDGHVVIITGAAQGIGRSAAILLAQKGARVAINDLDSTKAQEVVQEIRNRGGIAEALPGNMLDETFPAKLVADVLSKWGKINCLINNAGFCHDSAIHKMDDAKFDVIMKIHNYAPFRLLRALSPHWMDPSVRDMPKCVINVSSTSGLHGAMGQINYATAKAGIVGLTKTVAAEWGRYNVRANVVAYGWIDTRITQPPTESKVLSLDGQEIKVGIPMNARKWRDVSDIPLSRPGTADEAARVMLFLASPLSSYVTGTCVECTGGRYM
ncbi:hypothetical protein N7451_005510 [Penicillium sp. IBT 35674x]|nr:hypothetical protein N7451_005510 [Penicillium sp. IBT 35674x]